jgi:hypothetical protein
MFLLGCRHINHILHLLIVYADDFHSNHAWLSTYSIVVLKVLVDYIPRRLLINVIYYDILVAKHSESCIIRYL